MTSAAGFRACSSVADQPQRLVGVRAREGRYAVVAGRRHGPVV